MFGDIGWTELMLIGIVALIVIGPEDLPDMFRQIGRFTGKLRQMSREFSRAMEQAAKESGVKDVADDLKGVTSAKSLGLNKVKEAADRFEKWDPIKNAAKPSAPVVAKTLVPPPMPATPVAAGTEAAVAAAVEAAPTIHGPATQALLDKQAAKKAILSEASQKLKAVDSGAVAAAPAEAGGKAGAKAAAKPATKPAAKKAAPKAAPKAEAAADKPAPKPRAPRKTKKADEA